MPSIFSNQPTKSVIPEAPLDPTLPAPPRLRDIADVNETRKAIYDNVFDAVNNIGPLANSRHTLTVSDLQYVDPEDHSLQKQKEAILSGKSLYRRLRGTWRLTDNETGKLLDQKTATLAQVPFLSNRGTFIQSGTEYTLSSQMRLRPGIFVRIKENAELEGHVNAMPGGGLSHRYTLDPETGVFKINIGQAKLPLYPVLKAVGLTERELRKAWGNEITAANLQTDNAKVLDKLYARLARRGSPETDETGRAKAVVDLLLSMKLDPEVTKRTLGKPYESLSKDAIVDTTKKLLAVSRKEVEPDDRDHLAFQVLYSPEDLIAERITKNRAHLRQMLWKASFNGNLSSIQPGALTRLLQAAILHSGLGQAAEEVNSGELLDSLHRTTRLGEGGIGSIESVPDDSRAINSSQFGFLDPLKVPESFKVGIDLRLSSAIKKGSDGKIYAPMIDVKTGRLKYYSPHDLADMTLAFPTEMRTGKPVVAAISKGQVMYVPREEVQVELPHMEQAFSPLSNMIPMKSGVKGQRTSMGARFLTQALPLVNREAPLVQAGIVPTEEERILLGKGMSAKSYEEKFGKYMGAVHATKPGTVRKVTSGSILVQNEDGTRDNYELYNNFPYARKTFAHNEPLVMPGDRVGEGQLLAKSNYTDDTGTTSLGLNARVGMTSWRGGTYEDAIIISESFANRLSSEHMYQHEQEWVDNIRRGRKPFISLFPVAYTKAQLNNIDDDGIVKPGSVVKFGDPLILVAQEKERSHSQIHRGRTPAYSNKSLTWEHHSPGIVTDVATTAQGTTVAIKSTMPMQIGDKISNRYGSKGVVSQIVPDDEMPQDEGGRPFEVLLNPLGVISRINSALVAETVLGKIAAKTGKPYRINDFDDIEDMTEFVRNEMKKHNVKDKETITDPTTGKKIKDILTGVQYFLKLHHLSESKAQGRGIGGYTSEFLPARGGAEGSKKVGLLESNALLSHGATEFLRDAHLIRGQKNDAYWQSFMSGFRPPEPVVPFIYRKFVDSLKAAGINVVRDGGQLHVMALTDKDVDNLVGDRNITNAETVDWKEGLKPKKGGLFDSSLTGGHGGSRWAGLKLYEPLPNPAFEEPIRHLLDLTGEAFMNILAGRESIEQGTGPAAIKKALAEINVDKEIERARAEMAGTRRGSRDDAIKKLDYLKATKRLGIRPEEWVLSRVPILPPAFRPVSVMPATGNQLVSDANYLYRELFDANENLKQLVGRVDDVSQERLDLYNAFRGVVGLGDPIQPKNQERRVQGILKHIFGSSPKYGVVQRQLIGSTVEMVGRAVVIPDTDLDLDQVGLPESKAWDVYKPFLIRSLVKRGVSRLEAARAVKEKLPIARDALVKAMEDRPVVISRAPVLHRYGIFAQWPRLVKGDVMHLNPLITKGMNADFDGDTLNFHLPTSEEAKAEAIEKLLPSRNLLSAANFTAHYLPQQEYLGGLYYASSAKDDRRRPVVFRSARDAIKAYREGQIELDAPVEIVQS